MTMLKTAAATAILTLGLAGAATAQVYPGIAGSPGRGNSDPVAIAPNGAVVSNGYQAEPADFYRGQTAPYRDGLPLRGSPNSPNTPIR